MQGRQRRCFVSTKGGVEEATGAHLSRSLKISVAMPLLIATDETLIIVY